MKELTVSLQHQNAHDMSKTMIKNQKEQFNYKGYDVYVSEILVNPSGTQQQTALIYLAGEPVGGVFVDPRFEADIVAKAKAKIDSPRYSGVVCADDNDLY